MGRHNRGRGQHSRCPGTARGLRGAKQRVPFGSAELSASGCWDWVLAVNELFVCLLGIFDEMYKKMPPGCSLMNTFLGTVVSLCTLTACLVWSLRHKWVLQHLGRGRPS